MIKVNRRIYDKISLIKLLDTLCYVTEDVFLGPAVSPVSYNQEQSNTNYSRHFDIKCSYLEMNVK